MEHHVHRALKGRGESWISRWERRPQQWFGRLPREASMPDPTPQGGDDVSLSLPELTMTTHGARFVDVPGARLAVYDGGVSDHPILLLHGGPGVPDYLEPVANLLAADHRVIRFDQRGTGASPCHDQRFGLDRHVGDVEAVRQACGISRMGLFGHSWGGLLAQMYTSRHPDRVGQLCLCNSSIGVGEDWRAMERAVLAFNRRRGGWSGFLRLGLDQALALLPGGLGDPAARRMMARVWRHYFEPPSAAPPPSPTWLAGIHSRPIFATRQAILAADPGRLHPIPSSVPVLILFGERDIYGETTTRLIRRVPHARAVTLAGAGHIPWLQSQTAFSSEIRSFFSAGHRRCDPDRGRAGESDARGEPHSGS